MPENWYFITYAQAAADVREWSLRLPDDIICVAGVPRSGAIVALMLAQWRNIHYCDVSELYEGRRPWIDPLRRKVSGKGRGRVLIVDDTCWSGRTVKEIRDNLYPYDSDSDRIKVEFGVLYAGPKGAPFVDHFGKRVNFFRHSFEWNYLHDCPTKHACVDFDGVLCENYTEPKETGNFAEKYERHLETARCLIRPSWGIDTIITARLESRREQTVAWLQRHGIKYRRLVMHPAKRPEDRGGLHQIADYKANAYNACGPNSRLYIDDNLHLCNEIAKRTDRGVLHFPSFRGWNLSQPH